MLILAVLLILAGVALAVFVDRSLGAFVALLGLILFVVSLVLVADAEAAQVVWSSWSRQA